MGRKKKAQQSPSEDDVKEQNQSTSNPEPPNKPSPEEKSSEKEDVKTMNNDGIVTVGMRGAVWRVLFFGLMVYEFNERMITMTNSTAELDAFFQFDQFEWIQQYMPNTPEGVEQFRLIGLTFGMLTVVGACFPVSCLGFTVFLWLQFIRLISNFTNHGYLFCLFAFLSAFSDVGQSYSVDALFWKLVTPNNASGSAVPRKPRVWPIVCLRLQLAIVYLFASFWKWHPDWLSGKLCEEIFLGIEEQFGGRGHFGDVSWSTLQAIFPSVFQFLALNGLALDFSMFLSYVFVRPGRKVMPYVFTAHMLFHGFTFTVMRIQIGNSFPLACIFAEALLLPVSDAEDHSLMHYIYQALRCRPPFRVWQSAFVLIWLTGQLMLPLRMPYHSGEDFHLTGETYRWSWTMMLHTKSAVMAVDDVPLLTLFSFIPQEQVCRGAQGTKCKWVDIRRQTYLPPDILMGDQRSDSRTLPLHVLGARGLATLTTNWRLLPRIASKYKQVLFEGRTTRVRVSVFIQTNGEGPYARLVDSSMDLAAEFEALSDRSYTDMAYQVWADKMPEGREYFLRNSMLTNYAFNSELKTYHNRISKVLGELVGQTRAELIVDRHSCLATQPLWLTVMGNAMVVVLKSPVPIEVRMCAPDVQRDLEGENSGCTIQVLEEIGEQGLDDLLNGYDTEMLEGSVMLGNPYTLEVAVPRRLKRKEMSPCRDTPEDVLIALAFMGGQQ